MNAKNPMSIFSAAEKKCLNPGPCVPTPRPRLPNYGDNFNASKCISPPCQILGEDDNPGMGLAAIAVLSLLLYSVLRMSGIMGRSNDVGTDSTVQKLELAAFI